MLKVAAYVRLSTTRFISSKSPQDHCNDVKKLNYSPLSTNIQIKDMFPL